MIEEPVLHAQLLAFGFFWAVGSTLLQAHTPESPCPCRVWHWSDRQSPPHRPLSCRAFCRPRSVPDRSLCRCARSPARGSYPYAFSSCRCTAPVAARHWWAVGDGAPCRRWPYQGRPPAPGGWWPPGSRRAPAPYRERLRPVARRAASDESNSWSGVGSAGIVSHAWFVKDWFFGRRGKKQFVFHLWQGPGGPTTGTTLARFALQGLFWRIQQSIGGGKTPEQTAKVCRR